MLRSSQFDKPIVSFLTFLMSFQSEVLLWIYIMYFFCNISTTKSCFCLSLSLAQKIEKNSAMSRVSKMWRFGLGSYYEIAPSNINNKLVMNRFLKLNLTKILGFWLITYLFFIYLLYIPNLRKFTTY